MEEIGKLQKEKKKKIGELLFKKKVEIEFWHVLNDLLILQYRCYIGQQKPKQLQSVNIYSILCVFISIGISPLLSRNFLAS